MILWKFVHFTFIWLITGFFLVHSKSQLKDLNETTWREMLTGEWFIQFYAPWCPACKQLAPTWKEFSEWSEDLSIQVGQVDVTDNPGLSGRFMITALPTVYHAKDGVFRLYVGARDKDALFSFIEDKKWTKVEPISSWSSPQSLSMSTVAYFFQVSMILRDMHNYLTGEIGLHAWVAHAIFGVATFLTGILLGLCVVAIIDCIYSVRRLMSKSTHIKDVDGAHEESDMQPLMEGESVEDELLSQAKESSTEISDPCTATVKDSSAETQINESHVIKDTPEFAYLDPFDHKVVHRKVALPRMPQDGSGDGPLIK